MLNDPKFMLRLTAALLVIHLCVALAGAPREKLTTINTVPGASLNAAVFGVLLWLSNRVPAGRSLGGAFMLILFLFFGLLGVLGWAFGSGSYQGSWPLATVQVLYLLCLLATGVSIVRRSIEAMAGPVASRRHGGGV